MISKVTALRDTGTDSKFSCGTELSQPGILRGLGEFLGSGS